MNIIWIAPPAAGKGTYSAIFKDRFGFSHISAGDVLREEMASGSEIGKEISDIVSNGKMVDDSLMKKLIRNKLKSLDLTKPFMLDGYPRRMNQAIDYDDILNELNIEKPKAIFINIDKETGLSRILGRVNCPNCKRSYNINSKDFKPKVDNICDECGTLLERRSDDNKESYENRYNTYFNETTELIEKYRMDNSLIEVDGKKDPEDNIKEIIKILGVNND